MLMGGACSKAYGWSPRPMTQNRARSRIARSRVWGV